jgi:methyl-accepting chemotaxis protein
MNWLYDLKITTKVMIVILLSVIGISLLTWNSLMVMKGQLLADREFKTKEVVEVAYSVLQHFGDRVSQGEMTEEEAQQTAMATIKAMRYGAKKDDYLWINDMTPKMLMHPMKPELDGKDLSMNKDPTGKALFVEMVKKMRTDPGGDFVSYMWPKPGQKNPVAKISFVKLYQPWGWVIGTGIYIDDVNQIFWNNVRHNIIIVTVGAVLLLGLSLLITQNIKNSISEFKTVMTQIHSQGDLSKRLVVKGGDEIGVIAIMVNGVLDAFFRIIQEVKNSCVQLNEVSTKLESMAAQSRNMILGLRHDTEQVATAITELNASAQEVANNASAAAQATHDVDDEVSKGRQIVTNTAVSIQRLSSEVDNASNVIQSLANNSEQIGLVVEVINSIADQTNLLALNAAIEAARAGDQGRGFAVVAEEVRTLAQRTQGSTNEIHQMIENIQNDAMRASQVMNSGCAQASDSVKQSEAAGVALGSITSAIATISAMNEQIADAAHEQTSVSEEINRNIININQAAEQNAEVSERVANTSQDVARLSKDMEQIIAKFSL